METGLDVTAWVWQEIVTNLTAKKMLELLLRLLLYKLMVSRDDLPLLADLRNQKCFRGFSFVGKCQVSVYRRSTMYRTALGEKLKWFEAIVLTSDTDTASVPNVPYKKRNL